MIFSQALMLFDGDWLTHNRVGIDKDRNGASFQKYGFTLKVDLYYKILNTQ